MLIIGVVALYISLGGLTGGDPAAKVRSWDANGAGRSVGDSLHLPDLLGSGGASSPDLVAEGGEEGQ